MTFARFCRGESMDRDFSTKDSDQGIGLTLIREILDNHGFDFSLESARGAPTRFTIFFA